MNGTLTLTGEAATRAQVRIRKNLRRAEAQNTFVPTVTQVAAPDSENCVVVPTNKPANDFLKSCWLSSTQANRLRPRRRKF